ncbi:MAG: penicillin-binding protein [Candidatus Omnitrophica bacterium]|nr:penicillin-binding protein [Candidatus Omnitrophota bacterium]
MYTKDYKTRLVNISVIFTVILLLLSLRLLYLQVVWHNKMLKRAKGQHYVTIPQPAKRGTILDRNLKPLAINLKVSSVFAVAQDVKNKKEIARKLSGILNKDTEFLYKRLSRDKQFVWLKRMVSPSVAGKIKALNIDAIGLVDESKRFYPEKSLACQLIGFAGIDNTGLEGVEIFYDRYLKGTPGEKRIGRDAKGRYISSLIQKNIPPIDGYDVVLTIDEVIQYITEEALDKAYKKYHAKEATAIVMDAKNYDILAIANRPNYDLNNFLKSSPAARKNISVCTLFEPGSVFKIVTASGCLEDKAVSLNDVFYCENGSWPVRGRVLHDHRPHGNLTFREVIEQSSNIGTVKAAMILGDKKLYKYIKLFGFGEKTGIDIPGEISGMVIPPNKWSKSSITTIPMGHGVASSPIQLACAAAVVANKGVLMKPRIINKIVDLSGKSIVEFKTETKRRVVSEDTALKVAGLMEGVILRGTGTLAKISGYSAGGKTGTAAKIEPSGAYSKSRYTASFVGFAPIEDPAIVVCIMVDEPHPVYFGGVVAAPAFKEIVNATLRYLQIPPRPQEQKK